MHPSDPPQDPGQTSQAAPRGEAEAVGRMMPLVYDELRRIAASMLRARFPMSLRPTALVHEAFIKVAGERKGEWADEAHFRAVASLAMRRVLADYVRTRTRLKRGGRAPDARRVSLDLDLMGTGEPTKAVELDAALEELEADSPRVAKLVIFRFFGDLSVRQAADRLNVSVATAEADWRFARAWLRRRLGGTPLEGPGE